MQKKFSLLAVLFGTAMSMASAFTLDAIGYDGGALSPNPYSVFVPGYGEIVFEAAPGTLLVVNSAYQNGAGFAAQSLGFDEKDSVKITLMAAEPLELERVDQLGGDEAEAKSWDSGSVPEAAPAAIGLIGLIMWALRRLR